MGNLNGYRKFLIAALAAGLVAAQAALSDGVFTAEEWWQVGLAALAALGVVLVPNKPYVEDETWNWWVDATTKQLGS